MRIKRIEISGFKSFCDRMVLDFSAPITAVVGPNGCGKSNIVDAIRWCMGEQSAKHLRGKAMDDVIFAGSESRGPAGLAEVSLTFENAAATPGADAASAQSSADDALARSEQAERAAEDAVRADSSLGADAEGAAAESPSGEPGSPATEPPGAEVGEGEGAEAGDGGGAAPQGADEGSGSAARAAAAAGGARGEAASEPQSGGGEELLEEPEPPIDLSQFSEVTISRRLFRDGTSGYFMNKTPCRLRDITDFFMGTGIGTKAYSIIEQGRIGMIVSARPQDRRVLIEEAAGITKFKTKKRSAERKLEQTRQNLLRVTDIVSELEKRLGSLRRQAQKAERYRRYKAEIRDIELWSAAQAYLGKTAEDKVAAAALEEASSALDSVKGKLESRDAEVVAARSELATEERRLSSLQEALFELENRIALCENRAEYQRREADELDERVSAARGEIRGVKARREEAEAELGERRGALEGMARRVEESEEILAAKEASLARARQGLGEKERRLEEIRAELAQARADLARAESRRDTAAHRREDGAARRERLGRERGEVDARIGELQGEAAKVEADLDASRRAREDVEARVAELHGRKGELETAIEAAEAEVETLRTERHRRASRLQSLVEIHDKYEGFAQGTRAVMQNAGSVGGSSGQIRGLVADVVEAPERLEAAVEAALGDRLEGVIVDDHQTGARAVDYLKTTGSGRSAFVPLAAAAGRAAAAGGAGAIPFEDRSGDAGVTGPRGGAGEGVLGPMAELVTVRAEAGEAARGLLEGVLVVDSLERAVALHGRGGAATIVTLDGDVVDERGVLRGGSREGEGASVLAQKREIRELEEITAGLDRDLADATSRLTGAKQELQAVLRRLEDARAESRDREVAIASGEKDLARVRGDLEAAQKRRDELGREHDELEEWLAQLAAEEEEASAETAAARETIARREDEEPTVAGEVEDGRARSEALAGEVTEAKVEAAELREKKTAAESAIAQLEASTRELAERLERLEGSIRGDGERAEKLRADAAAAQSELETLRGEHREREETLRESRRAYEERSARVSEMEVEVRELRARSEELSGEVSRLEVELSRLREGRRHLEDSIADRYQIRLVDCLVDYHARPPVGDEEERRLAELRRLIDRMGSDINLTAIEEYEDISSRHEFLSGQKADLEGAVAQLEEAIQKINRTSRRLFRDTFDAVNAKFKEVFPKLFKGGQARLSLSGGEEGDVLDAGIEIFAQPPGKKNTGVDQLSGGEKALTAVALVFAIFLIKPSPFCLLDEVDAPLDDVNVDRYKELVRGMTDRSQFILITHNKRTMEIADRLYGVTMQEPGVSKIVSVNLNKLDDAVAA